MSDIMKATVVLPWTNVGDVRGPFSSNVWHFDAGGTPITNTTAAAVTDELKTLYETGMNGWWSGLLDGAINISCVNLSNPPPRLAFFEDFGTLSPEADSLPTENALTLSFKASRVLGTPQQRNRGRVSLGPLAAGSIDVNGRWSSAIMDDLLAAITTFQANIDGAFTWSWVAGGLTYGFRDVALAGFSNEPGQVERRQNARTDGRQVTF